MTEYNKEQLVELNQQLSKAMTDPVVLKELDRISEISDSDERLRRARENLTPEALRKKGVDLPDRTRLSTRYFEQPGTETLSVKLGDPEKPRIVDLIARERPDYYERLQERPDLLSELSQLDPMISELGITICASVGTPFVPVCVTVGDEVELPDFDFPRVAEGA